MCAKCQHGSSRKLPRASVLILTFILLIWTPHHLPQAFLLSERKKEAMVTDAEVSATAPDVSLYQVAITVKMLCNKPR